MLRPIRSDLLDGVSHGFFTREGGVSEGIFAGLNTGLGSSDNPAVVAQNRDLVRGHLGADALITAWQIHSAEAVQVDAAFDGEPPRADGLVTDRPGLALGMLTADCTPVLFADREARVVGAAHAGWKGALGGILEAVLVGMEERGADRGRVVAAIGPVISQRAYEVGPEFVEQFMDHDAGTGRFFVGGQGDRAMFDLPGYCLSRLRAADIAEAGWTGHCTYSDPSRFFSYRRSCHLEEADYGRMVAAIML